MIYLLYFIHVVVSLFLILVVLLQQGKGADLSVFGGGATQTAFGARGTASLLHKLTSWGFVAFIVTTISIGFMGSSGSGSSVMSGLPEEGETAVVEETVVPDTETAATPAEAEPESDEATGEAVNESDGTTAADETTDDGGAEDNTPDP
jgi:preprotein translocase subunit SecG